MVILDTFTGTALQCAAAVLGSAVDSIILLNIILPSAAMYLSPDSAEQPADSDSSAEQLDDYCSMYSSKPPPPAEKCAVCNQACLGPVIWTKHEVPRPTCGKLATRRRGSYKGSPEEMTVTKGSGTVASGIRRLIHKGKDPCTAPLVVLDGLPINLPPRLLSIAPLAIPTRK